MRGFMMGEGFVISEGFYDDLSEGFCDEREVL